MIRLTLKDAKPELSRIAGATGFRVNDARFIERLNAVTSELMDAGDWPGVVDRYKFSVYGGTITLPGDMNRIMGIAARGVPLEMRSPWYEFHQDGPGPQDDASSVDVPLERGESCTFNGIPDDETEYTVRVIAQLDERVDGTRPKIIIQGYDSDGAWIRTEIDGRYQDGVAVEINGDTAPKWIAVPGYMSAISAVIKPVTRGYVYLQATNGTITYDLASYAPKETNPSYRQYFIPSLETEETHTVVARVRKRFVPVREDNDPLIITNMAALSNMLKAIQKSDADDVPGYWNFRKIAVNILEHEARAYRGTTRKPAITMSAGFGMGGVNHVQ